LADLSDRQGDVGFGEAADCGAEGNVVAHREVGEQGVILEHGVHRALVGGQRGDVLAVQPHPAMIRLIEAGGNPQQSRLAAARGAEQRKGLALRNVERDVVDGGERAETSGDFFKAEERGHGRAVSLRKRRRMSTQNWGPGWAALTLGIIMNDCS